MSRALFYIDTVPAVGDTAVVDGDEGHHAANVRRIRVGEEIDLGDGAGVIAHCVVEEAVRGRLAARVLDRRTVDLPTPTVTVVQALPKSDRAELAVETATEAGADAFLAWQAARCVARWDGPQKVDKGLRRWRAVIRSAARQSRRAHIPAVGGVVSTAELTARVADDVAGGAVALVLHEAAAVPLTAVGWQPVEAVTLIVGPEGGITDDEIAELQEAGARAVRLGPTVLRTSTAAAVALGAIGVLTPRWR
ncbi:16S rRNA (uracil(1498)-N(3))-methyltransferase [Mycolicibacterium thermoresistibile]|uniref:Ribosomal RNA small subunit methyltransferase E n=2 Tax=Mycolicibacterium thermoresistibile TaxID=1797 RepID=G7CII3_MYCT3|nr:16S rRNA (uracil(1498)-N(3))-methyltransferase [Mycolicibacterium thermoresistibile]EHI12590.1 16S ribosomal RNA methyltransferase RsmE [Mycolicibacterium thermoresistibile ATCC 19527]MCV7190146.1 16S rRNA (uracil(1498)-N(3))-methyltransferase [Mycolicibacterium thermoresistibile]GAT13796.1 16S ribosomal RNA methyltransferase RsmE [Mycolicibacterium thermoresistibile]SNW18969.1 16S ribosomal RNA methyltransferase RsmE [Mycolicibacterium thermoresistibile]